MAGTPHNADDPRDLATYTVREAAHYLGLPASTVRVWARGQACLTGGRERRMAEPLFQPASVDPTTLSFWNLVEAYVLAGIRRRHGVSLQRVRKALGFVRRHLGLRRPLIEQQFLTDGVDLFVERYARLVKVSGETQTELRELLKSSLRRIERDPHGLPARFHPWIRSPDEPRLVEIDPLRAFGRLVISGTGIPTATLAERFRAGDSIDLLASDYRLTPVQVEEALRWEQCAAAA